MGGYLHQLTIHMLGEISFCFFFCGLGGLVGLFRCGWERLKGEVVKGPRFGRVFDLALLRSREYLNSALGWNGHFVCLGIQALIDSYLPLRRADDGLSCLCENRVKSS